jgi:hypothetical protein
MVVVRSRGQHQVGLPLAYLADDLLADIEAGHELAVVVVQDDVVDADAAAGFDGFGSTPHRQLTAAFLVVPRIPLVTATNRTLWPAAAHLAATPPERMSQSSGARQTR